MRPKESSGVSFPQITTGTDCPGFKRSACASDDALEQSTRQNFDLSSRLSCGLGSSSLRTSNIADTMQAIRHEFGHCYVAWLLGVEVAITNDKTHFATWVALPWQKEYHRLACVLGGPHASMMDKGIISQTTKFDDLMVETLRFLEVDDDQTDTCDAAVMRRVLGNIDDPEEIKRAFLISQRAAVKANAISRGDMLVLAKKIDALRPEQCLVLPVDALCCARVEKLTSWLVDQQEGVTRRGSITSSIQKGTRP